MNLSLALCLISLVSHEHCFSLSLPLSAPFLLHASTSHHSACESLWLNAQFPPLSRFISNQSTKPLRDIPKEGHASHLKKKKIATFLGFVIRRHMSDPSPFFQHHRQKASDWSGSITSTDTDLVRSFESKLRAVVSIWASLFDRLLGSEHRWVLKDKEETEACEESMLFKNPFLQLIPFPRLK